MENKSSNSEIKYTGVRKRKWGKWVSEIRLPNSRERIWLGSYDSPEKAARAFDAAQFCLRGKSANFNFPDNPPDISGGHSMTPSEIQAAAVRFANMDSGSVSGDTPMEEGNNNTRVEDQYYLPSISGETNIEIDNFDIRGVETSFHEQLSTTLGSGNYVSDFGCYTGFDDFSGGEFYTTSHPDNYNYVAQESQDDTYNTSFYQDSYLWNF